MAKRQSRRSVSLSRPAYVAASKAALRKDVTLSQLCTDALRAYGVSIPDTFHVPREQAEIAAEASKACARISPVRSPRLVSSYRRVMRDGPIRRALGDAHADACGEPRWVERVSV